MGKPKVKLFTPRPAWSATVKEWLKIFSISRLLRWAVYLFVLVWLYQNWQSDLPAERLNELYSLPGSRFISVDGIDVHCRITGRGDPILLLHDENNSLHTWADWTDTLSQRYRVISVDLPGFGLTGPHPRGSYSAFMYAGFLDALVRELDLQEFTLAGNGLGAQIAWFYATEHPSRLRKLILLNAPGFEEKTTNWIHHLARAPLVNRIIWKITPRYFVRLYLETIYSDDRQVTEALVQRHYNLLLRSGNRKAFTDRAQVSDNRPPADLIQRISTPTLILWGAEDTHISPEYAYEFHRSIRSGFLKIYQNTGHWPQQENPVQTVQDVEAFLEERF